MCRRDFIKRICMTVGAIGFGGLLYPYSQRDQEMMRRNDSPQSIPGLGEEEYRILYLASQAPSGHNTQPWRVAIPEPKRWIIGSAKEGWLPAVDPDNREMMLSIGAFLENVSVAAKIEGYETEIHSITKDFFSKEIAEVKFSPGKKSGISNEAIKQRCTVRKNVLKRALEKEDLNYLIGDHQDNLFYYPLDSKEGAYLSSATLAANRAQVNREATQVELAEWIRWTDREAIEFANGITPESMEMDGVLKWYVKHFFSKENVLSKTFKDETLKMVEEQVENCAGWLVITSSGSMVKAVIEAGRLLEAVWLKARDQSIAFHPMTQILEEEPYSREVAKELLLTGRVQFAVRIGYIEKYPLPVSLRMPVQNIIMNPEYL